MRFTSVRDAPAGVQGTSDQRDNGNIDFWALRRAASPDVRHVRHSMVRRSCVREELWSATLGPTPHQASHSLALGSHHPLITSPAGIRQRRGRITGTIEGDNGRLRGTLHSLQVTSAGTRANRDRRTLSTHSSPQADCTASEGSCYQCGFELARMEASHPDSANHSRFCRHGCGTSTVPRAFLSAKSSPGQTEFGGKQRSQ